MRVMPMLVALALAVGLLAGVGIYTFVYARGYSYLLDDPAACANCHIMRDNVSSWSVSSHRSITCNGCHVPHTSIVAKYYVKGENGFRHSWAFTFKNVQVLRITPADLAVLQENCKHCHEQTVSMISLNQDQGEQIQCTRCHRGAGHVF